MTVEKMFWDVWRSLGGGGSSKGSPSSSKSAQRTRYNRLKTSGGGGGPTKSISQPANLTSLCSTTIYSSSESLEDNPPQLSSSSEKCGKEVSSTNSGCTSSITPKGRKWPGSSSSSSSMKHSISSFFPFTSCTSSNPATNKTGCSQNPKETFPPEKNLPPLASSTTGLEQQKEFANNGADSSNICSSGGGDASDGCSSSKNKISLRSPNNKGEQSSWDQVGKEVHPQNQDIISDDISDLDDDVEHLTCDVCERAFPTLKQLAVHQKKKRHFGCLQCDSIFPSREVLEYHREQMSHYDYVIDVYEEGEDDEDFFESEDDEHGLREEEDCDDEERERLL